ncbi:MAG: GNAT family N-acetyltransferase [Candidatus Obscuribacterales bacterium]|nr:GNAT family N-acetyltransferase [Candidatus Obscuribacterales bacterium]
MIKIQPFLPGDSTQVKALLRHQNEPVPYESFCQEERVLGSGLTFWQHWIPCGLHVGPSAYVAKEDNVVLGLISIDTVGKSHNCWRVDHLVVHPQHRGRGIAQELLRFALAYFGSQGIGHFIMEVADQNAAALALLNSCGFRRCSRVTYYQVPVDFEEREYKPEGDVFRLALPQDKTKIFELTHDVIPSDMRRIFDYVADDFQVAEMKLEGFDKLTKRLLRTKRWYWVKDQAERGVIPCAVQVTAHREGDYHLEFFVHPGWSHMASEVVEFVLSFMKRAGMRGVVVTKVYDFQKDVREALEQAGLERTGSFMVMAREHWKRAKKPKAAMLENVTLPNLARPAVNIPFVTGSDLSRMLDIEYRRLEGFDPKDES